MQIVLHFVDTLHLSLSLLKSALWGTNQHELGALQQEFGIRLATSLEAFGATWQLARGERPDRGKEGARIQRVTERLVRVSHLPTHPSLRASVSSSTALSLLDYIPMVVKKPLQGLRVFVRKALALKHGAPEVVFNLPTSSMLDPLDRNFVSMLRLWILAWNDDTFSPFISVQNLKDVPYRHDLTSP